MIQGYKAFIVQSKYHKIYKFKAIVHIFIHHVLFMLSIAKADPGPARRARVPPFPFEKKPGTCFCKFSLYIRKYFDFSQHAVFAICILFTTLQQKHRVCVKGHQSKPQISKFYRAGTAHPRFETPGSAPGPPSAHKKTVHQNHVIKILQSALNKIQCIFCEKRLS